MKSLKDWRFLYRLFGTDYREKFIMWLVYKLPEPIVYSVVVRAAVSALHDRYPNMEASVLTAVDILKYYDEKYNRRYLPNLFNINKIEEAIKKYD
jgi:hypothetical protein